MDEYRFFHEAGRRICSSREIEKAFYKCFLYLRDHIPADSLSLHLFDSGLGIIETVVGVQAEGGVLVSVKTRLSPDVRDRITAFIEGLEGKSECQVIDRLKHDELVRPVARDLGTPDEPGLILDLILEGEYLGTLAVTNAGGKKYTEEHSRMLLLLHHPFALAAANFLKYTEVKRLKERLVDDYRQLRDDLMHLKGDAVVGAEQGLKGVMSRVHQVAPTRSPVLLLGETGVGKEVIAQAIHRFSPRREHPLIKVDCAAIPESLLESELFGHEKGAFTGAVSKLRGRFERAQGGTLFLDEIGELSPEAQKRILRVLEDRVVERVGGSRTISVDIRIIAATHRPLEDMVKTGEFRQDLLFRLNVFPVIIPPLRERKEDIPLLVDFFIRKKSRELGLPYLARLAPGAIDTLNVYPWPGNVRELENCVERELIIGGKGPLTFSSLWPMARAPKETTPVEQLEDGSLSLDRLITTHIRKVLDMTDGRVEGNRGAARLLDVHPRTLQHRMKKLNILFGRNYLKVRNKQR
ncbi:MAG: sigma 54-interacting transcriptional regulator [Deltaproteobacteria bacterium]|mgnify:CR=1 FL=1|nr:sigma 54-interacting transcriptional regulator [Deltaproteobacteria bacterium]